MHGQPHIRCNGKFMARLGNEQTLVIRSILVTFTNGKEVKSDQYSSKSTVPTTWQIYASDMFFFFFEYTNPGNAVHNWYNSGSYSVLQAKVSCLLRTEENGWMPLSGHSRFLRSIRKFLPICPVSPQKTVFFNCGNIYRVL